MSKNASVKETPSCKQLDCTQCIELSYIMDGEGINEIICHRYSQPVGDRDFRVALGRPVQDYLDIVKNRDPNFTAKNIPSIPHDKYYSC